MNRKNVYILFLLVAATGLSLPTTHAAEGAKGKTKPPPLIDVDEESVGYVRQAEASAARKDYAGAIKILQGLLDRRKRCFVPTEDPRLFVSLTVKVNEVIGQLPPEGMELYRRLYDPKAERLFRAAAERFDKSALRNIIARYRHTSYGNKALNLLGGIQFDRGKFSQAAYYWGRIISTFHIKDRPVLLAKIVIAHHFAGESVPATKAMEMLTNRYPNSRAVLGGKEQDVAVFARRILAKPPPARPRLQHDWPCLAGAPNSVAVMSPCRPILTPRWTRPGGKLKDNPNVKAALSTIIVRNVVRGGQRTVSNPALREGRVVFTSRTGGRSRRSTMAAHVHPIVVGTTVLYRTADGIAAHDLLTGEKLWQTFAFSLYRPAIGRRNYYYGRLSPPVGDRGRWTLTAGEEKVFAVGDFLYDSTAYNYALARGSGASRKYAGTSLLAAFSLSDDGRLLWQVGQGKGSSELLRGGKFLTAPTYVAGRVYVVVEYMKTHHLVCLNAESGRAVWEAMVGQIPVAPSARYGGYWQGRDSPLAVAAGKVFVVTNVGVAAAFEADTGRPLWAYQYESSVTRLGSRRTTIPSTSFPPNPVIVTKGRVICLPPDSDKLLAFRTDTGKLDWSADRRGLRNLTAVDRSRLLLSGKGLRIINAATGKEVWTGKKVSGVHGRPAVTTDAILASGKGEIIRVSLKDFSVTRLPVKQPDAILGNLISVNGKLIAANAAGVSVYFPKSQ